MKTVRLGLTLLACAALVAACSSSTIKAPTSDKNFDDPDDPGNSGTIGAVDASTADAGDANIACSTSDECPASFTCFFPVSGGCGAVGRCIVYDQGSGCVSHTHCGCDGKSVKGCAPEGYAAAPVASDSACGGGDAGSDAPSDAPAD